MVRTRVAGGAPGDYHASVDQQQAGAGQFAERVEAAGCRNLHRPAKLLDAGSNRQGMQPLHEPAALPGARQNVEGARRDIDCRRGRDADFRRDEAAAGVCGRHRATGKSHTPERGGGLRRGIERVHAVVFRGDENDVMRALAGHRHLRHKQRLRIHVPIDRERKDFAELAAFTLAGVRVVSWSVEPVRALSYCEVST